MQLLPGPSLAGQYKYDRRISTSTPPELLELFRQGLEEVDRLVTVGCSLGDAHINEIVMKGMEGSVQRRLVVVDPQPRIPAGFAKFDVPTQSYPSTATAFLAKSSGNSLNVSRKELQ